MPRKQRFKPSRKPKAVGTLTDLTPLDPAGPTVAPLEPPAPQEITSGEIEAEVRSRDSEVIPSVIVDLGGESG